MDTTRLTEAQASRDLTDVADAYRKARDAMPAIQRAVREASAALPRSTTLPALAALHLSGRHIYAGTVPAATVATRRRRNKAARKSRRVNRLTNFRKGVR